VELNDLLYQLNMCHVALAYQKDIHVNCISIQYHWILIAGSAELCN